MPPDPAAGAVPSHSRPRCPAWIARLCLTAFSLTLITSVPAGPREERLEQLRDEIAELRASLERDASRLTSAREQAFELERTVAEALEKQAALESRIRQRSERIEELRSAKRQSEDQLEHTRQSLHDNAAARYALSFQPKLKVLLHQDDARKLSRNLAYYDYVIETYRNDAEKAAKRLDKLARTEAALKLETDKLRRLRHETSRHLELLESVRTERANLITAVAKRMSDDKTRISQLEQDEAHLSKLLDELVAAPRENTPRVPFSELRGKLDWPTAGRVAKAPGMALRDGGARWAGVLIESASGSEVHAVAPGRVVFADWFRNLGQLVIVDHGGGYMTLYGNNSALHRQAGDEVEAGDTIATVGAGEGELRQGLYFELRAAGEPLDPRSWCVSRQ